MPVRKDDSRPILAVVFASLTHQPPLSSHRKRTTSKTSNCSTSIRNALIRICLISYWNIYLFGLHFFSVYAMHSVCEVLPSLTYEHSAVFHQLRLIPPKGVPVGWPKIHNEIDHFVTANCCSRIVNRVGLWSFECSCSQALRSPWTHWLLQIVPLWETFEHNLECFFLLQKCLQYAGLAQN